MSKSSVHECNKLLTFTKQLMQNNRGYNLQLNTCNSIHKLLISRVLAFKDAIKPDTDANIMNPAVVTSKTAAAQTERDNQNDVYTLHKPFIETPNFHNLFIFTSTCG